jgi:PmbA protein
MNVNLPKGAEYELRTLKKKSTTVDFDGNKFERIVSADQVSSMVRLAYLGKMSQASGTKPGSEEALIEKAAATVKYGSELEVPFVSATELKTLDLADETTMTSKEMIEQMESFVSDVRSIDSRLTVSARLRSEFTDLTHKTSTGFDGSYRKSVWTWGGSVDLMQGDDLLSLWEFQRGIRPDFNLKEIKETLAKKLEYAKTVVPLEAGSYPVIFSPGEAGYIVNPFVQSLNGQWVHRKVSPWGDKLGQELLDKGFSLVDDGSINREWTSVPFDLEGTPTRRNVMIQNGRLESLLTNRKVAAQLGLESSGNCSEMGISPHFLSIEPGNKSLEELISSIDKGLLIDGTMGAWSGNPFAGIVSGTISMGLKIEKGKIVGRVKDCMFSINAFEHFAKHFLGCSKETEQAQVMFSGAALFPYIMLDEVVISAK